MPPSHDRYQLSFERRKGYLYAYIKAQKIDHQIALQYLSEVWAHAAETRVKHVLLERDVDHALPLEEVDGVFSDVGNGSAGMRMAFVNRQGPQEPSLQRFIELNIATGADYEYFCTIEEAEQWLKKRRR
jgi:hypothetical protein